MKLFIIRLIIVLTAVIAWGVAGVEIFANGMDNLVLIEVCAYITLACLIGNLIIAMVRLWKEKNP
ncbi:MAG: hypothetical protein IIW12_04390 [Oscillospiraceae bacterium]|nr:hypothetical protein [Oscillospiraceae bacterium]